MIPKVYYTSAGSLHAEPSPSEPPAVSEQLPSFPWKVKRCRWWDLLSLSSGMYYSRAIISRSRESAEHPPSWFIFAPSSGDPRHHLDILSLSRQPIGADPPQCSCARGLGQRGLCSVQSSPRPDSGSSSHRGAAVLDRLPLKLPLSCCPSFAALY